MRGWIGFAVAIAAFGAISGANREARAEKPCGKTRFVTVYDSHGLTAFGDRLDRYLLGLPDAELTSYTLGGASPEWLLTTKVSLRGYLYDSCAKAPLVPRSKLNEQKLRAPSVDDLLQAPPGTYDKQIVLLTLGTNIPGDPALQSPNVESIVRRIKAHSDAICVWIGPPAMRKWSAVWGDKVYSSIRKGIDDATTPGSAPACHLIDSRNISAYPQGGDGWHYGFFPAGIEAAAKWAEAVGAEVQKIYEKTRPTTKVASR